MCGYFSNNVRYKLSYVPISQRFISVNAMSVDIDGTLYDYFDGTKHLKNKQVVLLRYFYSILKIVIFRLRTDSFVSKNPNDLKVLGGGQPHAYLFLDCWSNGHGY